MTHFKKITRSCNFYLWILIFSERKTWLFSCFSVFLFSFCLRCGFWWTRFAALFTVFSLVIGKILQITVNKFSSDTIFLSLPIFFSPSFTHIQTLLCPASPELFCWHLLLEQRSQSAGWVWERTVRKQFKRHESPCRLCHSWHRFNLLIIGCLTPGDICLALCCGITMITDWNKTHFPLMPHYNVLLSSAEFKCPEGRVMNRRSHYLKV